jgi:aldose 1-epimerase
MKIDQQIFGTLHDGGTASLYTLATNSGFVAKVTDYGGILVSLVVPDKKGGPVDVVLGYDSLKKYLRDRGQFGALIGRFANRIKKARFTLDGIKYRLHANDGGNALHGGHKAFHRVLWKAEPYQSPTEAGIVLSYYSKDREDGFPGNLAVRVKYSFTDDFRFIIEYSATTDKRTHVNLTNHSYFTLNGAKRNILDHEVMLKASKITAVGKKGIPTGELIDVRGTFRDFTVPKTIGSVLRETPKKKGFDLNYILDKKTDELALAARVIEPESGLTLETSTTEPALQFYTGNYLKWVKGKNRVRYRRHWGFCLETQHFPDSPNHPEFPSTLLEPGKTFNSKTEYRFIQG